MAEIERIHLEIIDAVDHCGSLTAAAKKLHLTQSALSHSIRKFEERLGVAVWSRENRGLRLTQAGEYLLAVARRLTPQFVQAEERLRQFAQGERGLLRIGIECHPCCQWLLKIASLYLDAWPLVDLDVKQKFQFGGIGALFGYEIDVLVTPDPLFKTGLHFAPVFDYEQVLVVNSRHPLCKQKYVRPEHLAEETLITYPISTDRLDVFSRFLTPSGITPKRHKLIETTEIMLQMVASGRGVAALPRWLVEESADRFDVIYLRMGKDGIAKQIFLGIREVDLEIDYVRAFMELADACRCE